MLSQVSNKLKQNNIYHTIKDNFIITRKSKVLIQEVNGDLSYLIGVIAGDGTLIKTKRKKGGNHYVVKIYANSTNFLEQLNRLFELNFKNSGKIIKDKRKQNTYLLEIPNASIYWYFEILNTKYKDSNLPLFCTNKEFFNNYLAGLIDTDGSISCKRVQLKLKDKGLIYKIYKKIKEANPNEPKINYTKNLPYYYIRFDNLFPLRWKTNKFKNQEIPV